METNVEPNFQVPTYVVYAAIAAIVLLIFSPCLLISYGFSDDYGLLLSALLRPSSIWEMALGDGRILYAPLAELSLQLAGSIENLRFVRAAGITAIGLFGLLVFTVLQHNLYCSRLLACLTTLLIVTSPSFQVMGAWTAYAVYLYSAVFSLSSFMVLQWGLDTAWHAASQLESGATTWQRWQNWQTLVLAIGLSGVLLFASLATHQSLSMCYWFGVGVWVLGRFELKRRSWSQLISFSLFFFALALFYFVSLKLLAPSGSRLAFSLDFWQRLRWFLNPNLIGSLNLPFLSQRKLVALIELWLLIPGMLLALWGNLHRRLLVMAIVGALLPIAFLPSLVAAGTYPAHRVRIAIDCLVIVLMVLAFLGLTDRLRKSFLPWRPWVAGALILGWLVLAQYHILSGFVIAQSVELGLVKAQLSEFVQQQAGQKKQLLFLQPAYGTTKSGLYSIDEFWAVSTAAPWGPRPLATLLLAELQAKSLREVELLPVKTASEMTPEIDDSTFVIDMRAIDRYR